MGNSRAAWRGVVQVRAVEGYDRDVAEIFLGVGGEPLTDALVGELVRAGWSLNDLRFAQAIGATFNRRRGMLIMPGGVL